MQLKRLRKAQHLTQAALGKKARLSTWWVRRVESERVDPSLSTLRKLAKALQVTIGELVNGPKKGKLWERTIG